VKRGIIYKATNKINNKCYIGKTEFSLENRKHQHKKAAVNSKDFSLFYRSIKKHGWDNFIWEVIETPTLKQLNKREKYYIKKYGTLNIAKGGTGGDTLSKHPNKKEIFKVRQSKYTTPAGKDNKCYKPITEETRNKIIQTWNGMEIPYLKLLSKKTKQSLHICKRTLLEENIYIPDRFTTQQKLLQAGINIPSRRLNFTKQQIQKIINLYTKELMSSVKIANIMGIKSGDAILKILQTQGIKTRTKSENATISNLKRSKNGKYKK
jgi:group I intron endonuclease